MSSMTVVVTGGGQGLGRAFALALAESDWQVAVLDVDEGNAAAVAGEICEAGGRAMGVAADVSDPDSLAEAHRRVFAELGPVRGLVNNAALFSTLAMGPFESITPELWDRVQGVNVKGAFLMCREFAGDMRAAGYGKIVNVSSATVFAGRPGYLHYVTSKAAIIGFTRALASELGPAGIRVNAIAPGSTATEVRRKTITDEARAAMAERTALRRVQVPGDVVGSLCFALDSASDFVTGQTLVIDGGLVFH